MNIMNLLTLLTTIVGDFPKVMAAGTFLINAIATAESTTLSGADKLTQVLNEFELFLKSIAPEWEGDFTTIAADVEAVVNDVVAFYNAIGSFTHGLKL
jgi:hypothetical protein